MSPSVGSILRDCSIFAVNGAARCARGIAFVLIVFALFWLWVAFRLASWPIRRLARRDSPAAARRAALMQLGGAAIACLAAFRIDDQADDVEPADSSNVGGPGYTRAPWTNRPQ